MILSAFCCILSCFGCCMRERDKCACLPGSLACSACGSWLWLKTKCQNKNFGVTCDGGEDLEEMENRIGRTGAGTLSLGTLNRQNWKKKKKKAPENKKKNIK